MAEPLTPDPIEELRQVLDETLQANAMRITTSRGGYVGGGQPHATLESDTGATEAVARGLLARKVAEPSRVLPAASPEPTPGLREALDDHELMTNPAECTCGKWTYRDERPGNYFNDHLYSVILAASPAPEPTGLPEAVARIVATYWRDAFMALDGPLRAGAHPLAMVLAALDGEKEPAQLGIEDDAPAAAALRALAASPAPEPTPGLREHWNPGDSAAMRELWERSDSRDRTLLYELLAEIRAALHPEDGAGYVEIVSKAEHADDPEVMGEDSRRG